MTCPKCRTEKAYFHSPDSWKAELCSWFFLVPMKCHHCYHEFSVNWFSTIGCRLEPPVLAPRRQQSPQRRTDAARSGQPMAAALASNSGQKPQSLRR